MRFMKQAYQLEQWGENYWALEVGGLSFFSLGLSFIRGLSKDLKDFWWFPFVLIMKVARYYFRMIREEDLRKRPILSLILD